MEIHTSKHSIQKDYRDELDEEAAYLLQIKESSDNNEQVTERSCSVKGKMNEEVKIKITDPKFIHFNDFIETIIKGGFPAPSS